MEIEVKTRSRVTRLGVPEIIVQCTFLPRGSGNRYKARRLAELYKRSEELKPHIRRIVVGTSAVTVHMRASLSLMSAMDEFLARAREPKDVPGQLKMFGAV
jgi:hypothetical protein